MSAGKPGMQTRILHQENIHVPGGIKKTNEISFTQIDSTEIQHLYKQFVFSVTFQNKSPLQKIKTWYKGKGNKLYFGKKN